MRRNAGKHEELTAMQQGNNRQAIKILLLAGLLPVIWFALRIAPALHGGLPVIIQTLNTVFQNPFQLTFNKDSLRAVLVFVAAYAIAAGIWLSSQRNFRKGEEYGSAKWGNAQEIVKRYRDPKDSKNLLLTQTVRLALNTRIHGLNLNIIIFGASGTGKSRGYVLPNLMQLNTSFVVLDPKGELLRTTGHLLEENGYEIVVLDLLHMEKSHCYNPFRYIRKDEDVQTIVTLLFDATTPKGSHSQEPFWDEMAGTLLKALMFLLYYEAPEEEQNFQMVLELIRAGEVREENENFRSVLDTLFDRLNMEKPGHIAYRYYENYRKGAGKTLKSIQASLIAHIEKFELDSVAALTMTDEMDLRAFGERKRALFAIIPDNDTSFNFIVSMLYTQLFQQLEDSADFDHRGSLPVPVHVIMDEFANIALPQNFQNILSTMRSRGLSATIILQNLAQLKALYEKNYDNIISNCDTRLFLGGNDPTTLEYINKQLGKETIQTNTYGHSRGRSGQYSTNLQQTGRDLMTPDELARLDKRDSILLLRGEYPIRDRKIDVTRHPNAEKTTVKGGPPYIHGEDRKSIATITDGAALLKLAESMDIEAPELEIYTEEELQEQFNNLEENK